MKKKKVMPKLVKTAMAWDWKDAPTEEDLNELLAPFGVTVTSHPAYEDGDAYAFIFSNRELTDEEYEEAKDDQ
jgi:hypothetical protein